MSSVASFNFQASVHILVLRFISLFKRLRIQIQKHRFDLFILLILMIVAGMFTYIGEKTIPSTVFECNFEATWFHGDISATYLVYTIGQWFYIPSESSHPLYPIITHYSYLLLSSMGMNPLISVRIIIAIIAALWVGLLYLVFRLMRLQKIDAILFTILGMSSAAAMFWLVVPETFSLGSLSILMAIGIVAFAEQKRVSPFWYTMMSIFTLGITVTNWMVGIIATFANNTFKKAIQISLNAICFVLIYWELRPYILTVSQGMSFFSFLFRADETISQESSPMLQHPGGPLRILGSFLFHSIIMPAYQVADKTTRWDPPLMFTQFSIPGSASMWGIIAVVLWVILLGLGFFSFVLIFKKKQYHRLHIVIVLSILGQLALHMVFGDETFLYSLHFAPLLILLVALGTQTRYRPLVLGLVGLLIISIGINNIQQFLSAAKLAQCIQWLGP
jgi:hypothetical protein